MSRILKSFPRATGSAARAPRPAHAGGRRVRASTVSHACLYDPSSWVMTRARLLQRSWCHHWCCCPGLGRARGVLIAILGSGGPVRPRPRARAGPLASLGNLPVGIAVLAARWLDSLPEAPVLERPLAADAPLDANSSAVVANLLHQEATESLGIATTSYGVPIYTVSAIRAIWSTSRSTRDRRRADAAGGVRRGPAARGAQEAAASTDANLVVYEPAPHDVGVLASARAGRRLARALGRTHAPRIE